MPSGRFSIFGKKTGKTRNVHGIISSMGTVAFERAAKRLMALYAEVMGRTKATVSDADVVEYLARGAQETRKALYTLKEKIDG